MGVGVGGGGGEVLLDRRFSDSHKCLCLAKWGTARATSILGGEGAIYAETNNPARGQWDDLRLHQRLLGEFSRRRPLRTAGKFNARRISSAIRSLLVPSVYFFGRRKIKRAMFLSIFKCEVREEAKQGWSFEVALMIPKEQRVLEVEALWRARRPVEAQAAPPQKKLPLCR